MEFIERSKKFAIFRTCLSQSIKKKEIYFFLKLYSSKCSSGPIKQNISRLIFFSKSPRNICFKNGNRGKNYFFWKKKISFKTILRTHRQLIWKNYRNYFAKSPKLTKYVIKPQENYPENSSGHVICSLWNTVKKFCHFLNVFGSKWENKIFFSLKTLFFSNYSSGFIQRKFGHPTEIFLPKVQQLFDPSPKNMEKTTIFEKKIHFFQNDPQGSLKAVLTNTPNLFCWRSDTDKISHRTSGWKSRKKCFGHVICSW